VGTLSEVVGICCGRPQLTRLAAVAAGVVAVKRAVLAWAGQEQAGSVQLLPFISAHTQTWQRIQTGVKGMAGTHGGGGVGCKAAAVLVG